MGRIVAYQVQDTGFFDPVVFKKDYLKSTEVFIFVDEGKRELWIWNGGEADVRTRFISSTVAAEIRRLHGLTFRVRSADQGHEPIDFWKCLDLVPEKGIGPVNKTDSAKMVITRPQTMKKSKIKSLKKKSEKTSEVASKKRKKLKDAKEQLESEYEKLKSPSTSTPICPQCKKGNLLPYSQIVKVTSRKKEVLPFAKWVCSQCNYSPKEPSS